MCLFFEEMKDSRYNTVKKLIVTNQISTFQEIMETIPKTRLALDLGIRPDRFNRLIENVDLFVVKDLRALAELLEVPSISVLTLVDTQINRSKKKK